MMKGKSVLRLLSAISTGPSPSVLTSAITSR
jgi:hypothetical protein